MKNFFETVKEFCAEHFKQVTFAIFVAVGTIFAVLLNRMDAGGYGNAFRSGNEHNSRHYYHSDKRDRYAGSTSNRKPWTMQKPSSSHSSKSSNSSGHK
ncbi:MAG: hypothetical protein IJ685_13880 [Selenomonadaceae bacterium]|nr:hypothetical protein [Selenomonadaceae bacterium]